MELHPTIKEILKLKTDNATKLLKIRDLEQSLEIAKRIFSGELTYCASCGDYFLSKCFFQETETVEEKICVYSDPINSGGDIYNDGKVIYTYLCCPKGCRHKIRREISV